MSVGVLTDLSRHVESYSTEALVDGVNMFGGKLPIAPENCVAFLRFPGGPPAYVMGRALPSLEQYNVQVLVRHRSYTLGERWIFDVHRILTVLTHTFVNNGPRVLECRPSATPGYVGDNEDGLCLFSCNYELTLEPQPL